MKKNIIAVLLIGVLLFSGCIRIQEAIDPTPGEYTYGIDLPDCFPKELKLPEYTIVYESDESDDDVAINCGLNRTLYSIVEFYDELFAEDIFVMEEHETYDEGYMAKGMVDDWAFSLTVTKPTQKYEKRVFMWVMEIELERLDEQIQQTVNTPTPQPDEPATTPEPIVIYPDSLDLIQGFWQMSGLLHGTDIYYNNFGVAVEIKQNMTITGYDNFEILFENTPFTFTSESSIAFEFNGEMQEVTFYFDNYYGDYDYLVLYGHNRINGETVFSSYPDMYMEKSTYQEMIQYKGLRDDYERDVALGDELSDEELEFFMMHCDWIASQYYNPDETYERAGKYEMYRFNTGHVGIYEDDQDNTYTFSWALVDNIIYLYFHNGDERAFLLDYVSGGFNATPQLFFFNPDEGRQGRALVCIRFAS